MSWLLSSVKAAKGTHSGGGAITVKRGAGDREVNITVQSDDGKPARTIAVIVGIDGSVAPDQSAVAAPPAIRPNGRKPQPIRRR